MTGRTLFDKIWDQHVVADLGDGYALLHVDRHLLHDLGGGRAVLEIAEKGYRLRNPGLTFATPDHAISSTPGRADTSAVGRRLLEDLRRLAREHGVRLFDVGEPGQGIVHVIGPELGLSLPGALLVCGDSHTCTHGGMGALAFGVGTSEVTHVLATQCLVQRRPKRLRVRFEGARAPGVTAKDMILYLIGKIGAGGGDGSAVEYAGGAIRALEIEERLTLCNLSIELGAKIGMVAPDDKTYSFLADRPFAPKGALWDQAVAHWRTL
ncbi:MAG TPA: aconitase family protein, partial [Stellaceae bacterium]|nr:aconitase family protein [Stellaceae bacterium]